MVQTAGESCPPTLRTARFSDSCAAARRGALTPRTLRSGASAALGRGPRGISEDGGEGVEAGDRLGGGSATAAPVALEVEVALRHPPPSELAVLADLLLELEADGVGRLAVLDLDEGLDAASLTADRLAADHLGGHERHHLLALDLGALGPTGGLEDRLGGALEGHLLAHEEQGGLGVDRRHRLGGGLRPEAPGPGLGALLVDAEVLGDCEGLPEELDLPDQGLLGRVALAHHCLLCTVGAVPLGGGLGDAHAVHSVSLVRERRESRGSAVWRLSHHGQCPPGHAA